MRSIIFVLLLTVLFSTISADIAVRDSDVSGTAGMSGGSLTTSATTQTHVPFTTSKVPTGSTLSITNDGNGKPYLIANSVAGPMRVVVMGTLSTTCAYNQFTCPEGGIVWLRRTDTSTNLASQYVVSGNGNVAFVLSVDDYGLSTATYAVFLQACQATCSATVSGVVFSATESVAVKRNIKS